MTLDEFVAEQKANIDKFAVHWREKNADATTSFTYPMTLEKGDWDEQLQIFADGDENSWEW